jgi:hypothetical protein
MGGSERCSSSVPGSAGEDGGATLDAFSAAARLQLMFGGEACGAAAERSAGAGQSLMAAIIATPASDAVASRALALIKIAPC